MKSCNEFLKLLPLDFCVYAAPQDKISMFVFIDIAAQLVFADQRIGCGFFNRETETLPNGNLDIRLIQPESPYICLC